MTRFFLLVAAALFVACGSDSNPGPNPPMDDAGTQQLDAGHQEPDAGNPQADAGNPEPDAGIPEPELTTISPTDPRIQYTGRCVSSSAWASALELGYPYDFMQRLQGRW